MSSHATDLSVYAKSSSIVTMALSRVVSEIFNVGKCRDLEIRVKRSLKVIESGAGAIR